jgi:hypothetical protein
VHSKTDTHNSLTYITKNNELTTDFCQGFEEVSHHVKADMGFLLRTFKDASAVVKNISLCECLVKLTGRTICYNN